MTNKLLHTPEGVRDLYNGKCLQKITLDQKILSVFQSYGYRPIQTPTFEFFDVFSSDVGTTPSKDLYKFFDREGNTLVLRPDITPGIARAVSKYFKEQSTVRLCYSGNVFINNTSYQGRLKESTQLGAEYIGEKSVESDGEMITMVVDSLKKAGLHDFQISVGHSDLFEGLIEESGLSDEMDRVKHLIMNKNFYGLQDYLTEKCIAPDLQKIFMTLNAFFDTPSQWEDIMVLAESYPRIYATLKYLKELDEVLRLYQVTDYIHYEFGLLTTHKYYTGIIFQGYSFGSGEPIVKGGRYDKLMRYFEKDAPAIGFAIELDQLMLALQRQGNDTIPFAKKITVLYRKERRQEAIQKAMEQRMEGVTVELVLVDSASDFEKKKLQFSDSEVLDLYS